MIRIIYLCTIRVIHGLAIFLFNGHHLFLSPSAYHITNTNRTAIRVIVVIVYSFSEPPPCGHVISLYQRSYGGGSVVKLTTVRLTALTGGS